jgi:hypothetical protein
MSKRAEALAERIAQGHRELIVFIEGLPPAAWHAYCQNEERTVGVIVHHVASVLPTELDLVQVLASGQAITGVTVELVDQMNAQHAQEHANCELQETLDLLRHNSARVVSAIRELSDAELDRAAPVSLHWDAPLTTQYFIEDHPLGHAYHHLATIKAAMSTDTPR